MTWTLSCLRKSRSSAAKSTECTRVALLVLSKRRAAGYPTRNPGVGKKGYELIAEIEVARKLASLISFRDYLRGWVSY